MQKLLIANRGEIARRLQRGARKLGIATVAVYSEADSASPYVAEADQSVALGGNTAAESYLSFDKILGAARLAGADAIHPGYGFLSENAQFAQAVADAGLIWVGPSAGAMHKLSSKAAAKRLAQELKIPTLPAYFGAEQGLERLVAECEKLGAPLMLKAASGGGGRGMRLLLSLEDKAALREAIAGAQREALAGFGDASLVLERALLAPRHVEVQIFADTHGNCIHLGERDCSVQRRHQKIIEEAPSPAVDEVLRAQLGNWAISLAQAAGYVGAGTVEFLLEQNAGKTSCYLMEMNTRLQVEHPVTEAITGLDLVEWQLRVARGEALPVTQSEVRFQGHAIEVRLCAEDDDFVPQTGTVRYVRWPDRDNTGLRIDHALAANASVSPYYDSMLAKVIAHAPSRKQAREQLIAGLDATVISGIATNRQLLRTCLAHPVFAQGDALIPFLSEQRAVLHQELRRARDQWLLCAAAALALQSANDLPAAGRNRQDRRYRRTGRPCAFVRQLRMQTSSGTAVNFSLQAPDPAGPSAQRWLVQVADEKAAHTLALLEGALDGQSRILWDGLQSTVVMTRAAVNAARLDTWHVQIDGSEFWLEDHSLAAPIIKEDLSGPWSVRAPFNGKVVKLAVAAGQTVSAGETLLVIESMKLEHGLAARRAGVIESIAVAEGQQVGPGQVLMQGKPCK